MGGSGYASTKAVSEVLVRRARAKGLAAAIHRPGLLVGGRSGWPQALAREVAELGVAPAGVFVAATALDRVAVGITEAVCANELRDRVWADRLLDAGDLDGLLDGRPAREVPYEAFLAALADRTSADALLLRVLLPPAHSLAEFLATQQLETAEVSG